jgi:hypothetical protein
MIIIDNYSLGCDSGIHLLQLFIITTHLYQQTEILDVVFGFFSMKADFSSLYNISLVWIKSMASDFEFRHAEVLEWILLYAQYLDTNLG